MLAKLVTSTEEEALPRAVMQKYQWLQDHGFPVVPGLFIPADPDYNMILARLVGEDSAIYDMHNPVDLPSTDVGNIDQIVEQILGIAEAAFAKGYGVYLSRSSYAVVVSSKLEAEVLLLDLGARCLKLNGPGDKRATLDRAIHTAKRFLTQYLGIQLPSDISP